MPSRHTDKSFETDLADLRQLLLTMGARIEAAIARSMQAVADRDSNIARQIIDEDAEVNRLEVDIDERCRKILALRQPAASDLRLITTALKIVTDLERCGDLAVNIAERARDLNEAPPMPPNSTLPRLAELSQIQIKKALDAFVAADVDLAAVVLKDEEMLDALFLQLFNELLTLMMEDPKYIRRATALMFIAKHLERVGDHATNVAEMVVYMVKGTDIRHPWSRNLSGNPPSSAPTPVIKTTLVPGST
jgi:phosphate transport system protein